MIAKSQKMFLIEAFHYQAAFASYHVRDEDPFLKQTCPILNIPTAQQCKTTHLLFLRREIILNHFPYSSPEWTAVLSFLRNIFAPEMLTLPNFRIQSYVLMLQL